MSTTWLEVARPGGRADDLLHLAHQVRRGADDISFLRHPLAMSADLATAEWSGLAAYAFHHQHQMTQGAITQIGDLHREAAAIIEAYAEKLDSTQNTARTAVDQIHSALDSYTAQARAAFQQIVRMLRGALDNPVADLVGDVFPAVERIVDRLLTWQPPTHLSPALICQPAPSASFTSGAVEAALSATDWGIARLLDGIDSVLHFIGDLIHGAIGLVKKAEDFLSRAVAAAQDLARRAFEALVDFGRDCARKIASIGHAVYDVAVEAISQGVYIARHLWSESANIVEQWLKQKLGIRNMHGTYPLNRFPAHSRERFEELKDLASRVYDDTEPDKICTPSGNYRRLSPAELRQLGITPQMLDDGHGGFYAAVFYNEDTGQYVLSFRGSQSATDWLVHNPQNAAGVTTDQGRRAVDLAVALAQQVGSGNMTAVGHSTGGALAAIAAVATGAQAVTYNAAGVGQGNLDYALNASGGRPSGSITNYVGPADPLTIGQQHTTGSDALGNQVTTDTTPVTDFTDNPIDAVTDRHGLDSMLYPGSASI
ncbi:hypothetical protein [Nocardioides humilatus]|nr:hypothetical protein [Nocardioides humilatus]